MKQILLLIILLGGALFHSSNAQVNRKCATQIRYEQLGQYLPIEKQSTFEIWLQNQPRAPQKFQAFRTQKENYRIPVVVHIIHNINDPEGLGSNISEAQVLSQLEVLNEDFQRLNSDTIFTPDIFKPVAADIGFEFVLAKRSPDGLPTNGIVRVASSENSWNVITDEYELKALSYWPAEDYLNIWVVNDLDNRFIAFATYPVSTLPGVDDPNFNRLIDGIVIDHNFFGSSEKGTFPIIDEQYNKGRTLTHEIGHYFGLRHIWGDGACNADDYCNDTPNTESATFDCPTDRISCDGINPAMIENYMDYTDDRCMNLFTRDQKDRMITVMQNSPRRLSLLSSPGLVAPDLVPNDISVKSIVQPNEIYTGTQVAPIVEIVNGGTNLINSFKIEIQLNEQIWEVDFQNVDLDSAETRFFTFPVLDLAINQNELSFEVAQVNGGADNNPFNNISELKFIANAFRDFIPVSLNYNSLGTEWALLNEDNGITWVVNEAPEGNKALSIDFFSYNNSGTSDWLVSPALDFSLATQASLSFKYAYGSAGTRNDGLAVLLYTRGGNMLNEIVFERFGSALHTVNYTSTRNAYDPDSIGAYRQVNVDLSDYAGLDSIRVAFVATNDGGNNLFLDDIEFFVENNPFSAQLPEDDFIRVFPNPTRNNNVNLAFNLQNRQDLQLTVVDTYGHTIYNKPLGLVLNQTILLEMPGLKQGVYFFKLTGNEFNHSLRVVII